MTELLKVLAQARRRLEKGWTQGQSAVDQKNRYVFPDSPKAVRWCIVGALDGEPLARDFVAKYLPRGRWEDNLAAYNDAPGRTKAQVLKVIDKAIAAARNGDSTGRSDG